MMTNNTISVTAMKNLFLLDKAMVLGLLSGFGASQHSENRVNAQVN